MPQEGLSPVPMVPFHLKQQHSHPRPRVWLPSRALRPAQDGLVPGPCLPHSRRPSPAPDHGGVTFHESCTLKQKGLLLGPLMMPHVSDQLLSISSSQSRGIPKRPTRKQGHLTHQGPCKHVTPNPNTSTRFPQGEH